MRGEDLLRWIEHMRWFFFLFLMLFAVVANMAVFTKLNASKALAGVALNLVLLGLAGIWHTAYWLKDRHRAMGIERAISLVVFGCGVALGQHALELLAANECPSPSRHGRVSLLSRLFEAIIDAGYCEVVLAAYLLGSVGLLLWGTRIYRQARR